MPFGQYKDFDACVRANQDKSSPEGYCASIEKKITGEWPGVKKADLPPSQELIGATEEFRRNHPELVSKKPVQLPLLKPGTVKKSLAFVMKAPKSHPEFWSPNHLHTAKTGFPECHRCKKPIEAGSKYYRWQWPDSSVVRVHEQHRTEE